jgi:protein TonB
MFDAVLKRSNAAGSRIGTGATASVLLHAALLASALWISTRPQFRKNAKDLAVKFVVPKPPAPPAAALSKRTVEIGERKTVRRPDTIVQPKEISKEKPQEAEPAPDVAGEVEGSAVGSVDGVPGGVADGIPGGVLEGQPTPKRIQIDESNIKLQKIAGPTPQYTEKALENGVEGTMVVKCAVTAEGAVNSCRVLKSLPFMDHAAIDALEKWRFKPHTVDGTPVDVDYTFRLKLTLGQ